MDTMNTTGWWTCSDCGADAELPAPDTSGFLVACPDCPGAMAEQWSWDISARGLPGARPLIAA